MLKVLIGKIQYWLIMKMVKCLTKHKVALVINVKLLENGQLMPKYKNSLAAQTDLEGARFAEWNRIFWCTVHNYRGSAFSYTIDKGTD